MRAVLQTTGVVFSSMKPDVAGCEASWDNARGAVGGVGSDSHSVPTRTLETSRPRG